MANEKPQELVPAQIALTELEAKIFGVAGADGAPKHVLRDPSTGTPIERGHGSPFAKASLQDRTHYLTLVATAAAEEAHRLCLTLSAVMEKLVLNQKEARAATAAIASQAAARLAAQDLSAIEAQINTARAEVARLKAVAKEARKAKTAAPEIPPQ